jgi:hypothetical protein
MLQNVPLPPTMYLVFKDDGNVCCPGSTVVAVCSTPELAESFIRMNCTDKYNYVCAHVEDFDVDVYHGN